MCEYESDSKSANCECGIKNKEFVISELINQTDILSHNFTSKEKSSNMITMKCYYTLFTKDGLSKNIGSYILLIIILSFIVLGILFYKCGHPLLEEMIKEIIKKKEKKEEKEKEKNKKYNIQRKETSGEKGLKRSDTVKSYSKKNTLRKKPKEKDEIKNPTKKKKKNSNKKEKKSKRNVKLNIKDIVSNKLNNNHNTNSLIQLEFQNIIKISPPDYNQIIEPKSLSEFYDYDLNTMSYADALKYDKRTFCNYYCSLIKTKNYILFAFCPNKDYNSALIKLSLFLLFFSVFYFINALFFDEQTIHKIYEDEGLYNFIYLVPHIFCSFAISHTINTVVKYIFLSERNIYDIKSDKNNEWEKTDKIKRCLIIKYICFYCGGTICLMFFWYYLSSFGAVYHNTQIYLIKNISISFAVALVYPFIISILIAMMRITALKGKNSECLYKVSRFCQYI